MDPNAALANLRQALEIGDTIAAAQAGADLDEWLSKGGFLPADWQINPVLTRDMAATAAPTLDDLISPEGQAARAARAANSRQGEFGGRDWSDLPPYNPEQARYPKSAGHTWGAFAGLAVELGGYNDMELVDPYSGRRFWLEKAYVSDGGQQRTFWDALRATIDAAEAAQFGKAEHAGFSE